MSMSESVVLIGSKPLMQYVVTTILQFNRGFRRVVIKARGKNISKAVDVAEIVRLRFLQDEIAIKDVKIGSERLGEPGKERLVSTIEIVLERR